MESDNDKKSDTSTKKKEPQPNVNMNHEDLSDVSDLDESIGGHSEEEDLEKQASKLRQQIEEIHNPEFEQSKMNEKTSRTEEGEEQLDFEAEDGECGEVEPSKDKEKDEKTEAATKGLEEGEQNEKEKQKREDLEEGEVTDEDDARPEETEPRPVCRFFSRGQCTWGASCRFLHPGVTDKGLTSQHNPNKNRTTSVF